MTVDSTGDELATITVTYQPDIELLRRQVSQLPSSATRIVVDNASAPSLLKQLRQLADEYGIHLITNDENVGLASATNQGIRVALREECASVLLLDQDTEPGVDGVAGLRDAYRRVLVGGQRPGCIGPRMVDPASGLEHGFHRIDGWRWVRVFPPAGSTVAVACSNLNGSGTLIPLEVIEAVGGLDGSLFIDHVDTEWAFRVLDAGFGLYGAPDVAFAHRMGERSFRFWWLRWRLWPYRSPLRHWYLYRNAVALIRRDYVPAVWKVWAVMKLLLTWAVHFVFDRERFAQTAGMLRGIRDGLHMPSIKPQDNLQ